MLITVRAYRVNNIAVKIPIPPPRKRFSLTPPIRWNFQFSSVELYFLFFFWPLKISLPPPPPPPPHFLEFLIPSVGWGGGGGGGNGGQNLSSVTENI